MSVDQNTNVALASENSMTQFCPICLDNFTNIIKLPCNHDFCTSCVKNLKHHNIMKCPLCRSPFCYLQSCYSNNNLITQSTRHSNQIVPENIIQIELNNQIYQINQETFNLLINNINQDLILDSSFDIYDIVESQSSNNTRNLIMGVPIIIPQHHVENILLQSENQNIGNTIIQNRSVTRGSRSRRIHNRHQNQQNGIIHSSEPTPDVDEIQRKFLCRFFIGFFIFLLIFGILKI